MNNSIKEILYCDMYNNLDDKKYEKLLNYITNLQQEIKEANDSVTWWTNRFNALQKENEHLKLNNPEMNIEHFKTIKENKRKIDILRKQNKDYKSRNEKAIEYIKSLKNYRFEFTFGSVDRHEIVGCEKNFVKDLLNILQGGDE